ncbi:hypothetical protein NDU88_004585 [Pleurodeles waltl]|uniref:Uncharacterized protein n=1 Tax=Pleurodeles waltl TaxID=8319 RepID=A0AAV7SJ75_PLEWA|nr:hypothetical protein NDU88_004585 [Pleurodeles waltl]
MKIPRRLRQKGQRRPLGEATPLGAECIPRESLEVSSDSEEDQTTDIEKMKTGAVEGNSIHGYTGDEQETGFESVKTAPCPGFCGEAVGCIIPVGSYNQIRIPTCETGNTCPQRTTARTRVFCWNFTAVPLN